MLACLMNPRLRTNATTARNVGNASRARPFLRFNSGDFLPTMMLIGRRQIIFARNAVATNSCPTIFRRRRRRIKSRLSPSAKSRF